MLHTLISEIAFALESFLLDAEARQLRPATLRYYRQQLTWFLAHCQASGLQKPEEITAHLIRAYLAGLQARGLSASSVHAAARAVRAFANFLEAEGLVCQSPMRRVRMPKVDKRLPDAYTVDEVRRILASAASNRDHAMVLCLLDSGCRASEFLSWNVGDVNVMTGTVHVRHGKNRSERTVYLGVKARRSLLKHLGGLADRAADKPVWANEHTGERPFHRARRPQQPERLKARMPPRRLILSRSHVGAGLMPASMQNGPVLKSFPRGRWTYLDLVNSSLFALSLLRRHSIEKGALTVAGRKPSGRLVVAHFQSSGTLVRCARNSTNVLPSQKGTSGFSHILQIRQSHLYLTTSHLPARSTHLRRDTFMTRRWRARLALALSLAVLATAAALIHVTAQDSTERSALLHLPLVQVGAESPAGTPTPPMTATGTHTATPTTTANATITPTETQSPTPTATATETPTITPTPRPTDTPTPTSTATATALNPGEEILIPAGAFQMGCDSSNDNEPVACNSDEQPLHTVNLSDYYIDRYEVTNARYKACVEAGSCTAPDYAKSYTRASYYGNTTYANYPVIFVNWYQADTFCQWESKRLPTEAEWEKAARGPNSTRVYPWGDAAPTCNMVNGYLNRFCVGDTSAVGSYPSGASPYGVMDLAGNVWEWVNDWFDSEYYSVSPVNNPPGPTTGTYRVRRGAAFDYWYQRTADRDWNEPDFGWQTIGFRCARSQ